MTYTCICYINMSDYFLNSDEEKENDLAVKMQRRELFASIIVLCCFEKQQ